MRHGVVFVIALAACGDNSAPHTPDASGADLLKFSPCQQGSGSAAMTFECATLVVPADYSAPDGATISLPVIRAPARMPSQRIGALSFNFGGPGGATQQPIVEEYPNQPIASATMLADYFDFVLIDWRGVATTTPQITCLTSDTGPRLAAERFAPASDSDWAAMFQLVDDVSAGCTANTANAPLLAHQDSESAARDLDALRAGLGEDKLNLWVVSYGTRLGAMYSNLFPDRVRAIVLDSPMNPVPDLEEFLTTQSASFEDVIQRFFLWCAGTTTQRCPFRTSDGVPASVSAKYEALLATADSAPVSAMGITLDRPTINLMTTTEMYTPKFSWRVLAMALQLLETGDGSLASELYMFNEIDSASNDNSFASYQNVCAQDIPLPDAIATPATFRPFAESLGAMSPHVGLQNSVAQAFALAWPAQKLPVHPIAATTAPPLLITATRHDPATNYSWATKMQAALANGSYLVTYEGDGHGNGSIEPCLGEAAAAFLLDPNTPPAHTDCPEVVPREITPPPARLRTHAWK
jgi:pimeloyl-ACP methyl ester carboxylesterase